MEMNVLQEQQNPLFSRKEVKISIRAEITPSKEESIKAIAKKYSVDESLIRIRDITGKFGSQEFIITTDIYETAEEFSRLVKKTKQEIEAEKKAEAERIEAEEEAKKVAEEAANAESKAGEEAQSE